MLQLRHVLVFKLPSKNGNPARAVAPGKVAPLMNWSGRPGWRVMTGMRAIVLRNTMVMVLRDKIELKMA